MKQEKQINDQELFREYSGKGGVCLYSDASLKGRYAYLENMYIDCDGKGLLESFPGFRRIISAEGGIHSFAIQITKEGRYLVYHSENRLYRFKYKSGESSVISEIEDNKSHMTAFGSLVIINDGKSLYSLNDKGILTTLSDEEDILGCRSVALFDGRLFFSANGEHKGKIFYSSKLSDGDLLISKDVFLYDGGEISHILAHGGRLWVFRSRESETEEICCHSDEEGYPVRYIISGLTPLSAPIAAGGKIMLLTEEGLSEIELSGDNALITNLSREVNPMLLRENLKEASLLLWRGYLLIGCRERIYLGLRSPEGRGLDWYFINGIGGHKDDRRVFRYAKIAEQGYDRHKSPDERAVGTVISLKGEDGRLIYYSKEGDKKYSVYPTDERWGGILLPALELASDKELLLFSTENGIYIFNNDMRGVAPEEIRSSEGFDEVEYKRLYGNIIHPDFYSFDHHSPTYVIAFHYDDCDQPLIKKSSVGQSLRLRLRVRRECKLLLKINTDSERNIIEDFRVFPEKSPDRFYEEALSSISMAERSPAFHEKQIIIEAADYCSPIAFHSLAFRYRIKDKIKKG